MSQSDLFSDAYRGKRVLVTGHTGFKGSWLSAWLVELGATVAGFALAPESQPALFNLYGLDQDVDSTVGDVRDYAAVEAAFQRFQPEVVFHLAAQPLVRRSYREPKETFDINVGGTVNVLEAMRTTPSVRAGVLATTDKCYDNREWTWGYRENDAIGGRDPYSASKGAAEVAIGGYLSSFFSADSAPACASVRAGNVIGGGDWAEDRIVPDLVRAVEAGAAAEIRSPDAVRPWQHVLEPLAGYLRLGELMLVHPRRYNGAWNFGPIRRSIASVRELVDRFFLGLGRGEWRDVSAGSAHQPHEAKMLWLCCDKAQSLLGWYDIYSTAEAVDATAAWYGEVSFSTGTARQACLADIDKFVVAARKQQAAWLVGEPDE